MKDKTKEDVAFKQSLLGLACVFAGITGYLTGRAIMNALEGN